MTTAPPRRRPPPRRVEVRSTEWLMPHRRDGGPALREGTLDLFNKITPRLAGGGVLKDWDHRKINGIYLTTALRRCSAISNFSKNPIE